MQSGGHETSLAQGSLRLLERALELAEASGCDIDHIHSLVDRTFRWPSPSAPQVLGLTTVLEAVLFAEALDIHQVHEAALLQIQKRMETWNRADIPSRQPAPDAVAWLPPGHAESLTKRLLERAQRIKEARPAGASDGSANVLGIYNRDDAELDKQAAAAIGDFALEAFRMWQLLVQQQRALRLHERLTAETQASEARGGA